MRVVILARDENGGLGEGEAGGKVASSSASPWTRTIVLLPRFQPRVVRFQVPFHDVLAQRLQRDDIDMSALVRRLDYTFDD